MILANTFTTPLSFDGLRNLVAPEVLTDIPSVRFNNIVREGAGSVALPVIKTEATAYFLEEGENTELTDTSVLDEVIIKQASVIVPKVLSYQAYRNLTENQKGVLTDLSNDMLWKIYDKIDSAVFSSSQVAKTQIKTLFNASARTHTITNFSTLLSFRDKLTPVQRKDAFIFCNSKTLSSLVANVLKDNTYCLNTQDLANKPMTTILGVPVIETENLADDKIIIANPNAYCLVFDNKVSYATNSTTNGNYVNLNMIFSVGGDVVDKNLYCIGTLDFE